MAKKSKFDVAVENLVEVCGFDKSESASEAFLEMLGFYSSELQRSIREAHRDGLCFDATHALARRLREDKRFRGVRP